MPPSTRPATALLVGSVVLLAALTRESLPAAEGTPDRAAEQPRAADRGARSALTPARGAPEVTPAPDWSGAAPYRSDEIVVLFRPDVSADVGARELGARLVRAPGPSGYARVAVPDGQSPGELVRRARASGQVVDAGPLAQVFGAGKGGRKATTTASDSTASDSTASDSTDSEPVAADAWADVETHPCQMRTGGRVQRADSRQWHLDAIAAHPPDRISFSGVTVAVLDTGVAYESHSDDSGTYVQAPSLAGVPIVAPWDFVNDDAHANDDHQHGTHIASVIASRGAVEGVAPGAALMPLKVLDADNTGNELDLVDAIYHAIENGADIINMSLSFHPDYPGSLMLRDALSAAAGAGVFVVAAAGNDGLYTATWPAAHPDVYAVAANGWSGSSGWTVNNVPGFTNRSARVDILAPGGDLGADDNADGIPDGIVAETIDPADPTSVGLWAIAGSSQAAAIAAAAAAYPIAAGHSASMVPFVLSDASWSDSGGTEHDHGLGAGLVLVDQVQWLSCASNTTHVDPERVHAAVLPVISRPAPGMAAPVAHVKVTDASGAPLSGQVVHATLSGTTAGHLSCETDASGACLLSGAQTPAAEAGAVLPLQWSVSIDTVIDAQSLEPYRPNPVLWASDALEILLTASDAAGAGDGLLALSWTETTDPVLGDLAPGYTVLAGGTGLASSPLGVVFNREAILGSATITESDLDLDGTGLASSPLGFATMTTIDFSGAGLASSPLGVLNFRLTAFRGTGLASSPLGFSWATLAAGGDAAHDADQLDLNGGLIDLQGATILGASSAATLLGDVVGSGGWTATGSSLDGPSVLMGSGTLDVAPQPIEGASDSAAGAAGL